MNMYCTIRVNGQDCPVTNMFDIDGDELGPDDTLEYVERVVVELPSGKFAAIEATYEYLRPLQ